MKKQYTKLIKYDICTVAHDLKTGFPPEILKNFFQAFDYDPFISRELVGREFQSKGLIVTGGAQVVEKAGKGQNAVTG